MPLGLYIIALTYMAGSLFDHDSFIRTTQNDKLVAKENTYS
jgi:hypothetical protein